VDVQAHEHHMPWPRVDHRDLSNDTHSSFPQLRDPLHAIFSTIPVGEKVFTSIDRSEFEIGQYYLAVNVARLLYLNYIGEYATISTDVSTIAVIDHNGNPISMTGCMPIKCSRQYRKRGPWQHMVVLMGNQDKVEFCLEILFAAVIIGKFMCNPNTTLNAGDVSTGNVANFSLKYGMSCKGASTRSTFVLELSTGNYWPVKSPDGITHYWWTHCGDYQKKRKHSCIDDVGNPSNPWKCKCCNKMIPAKYWFTTGPVIPSPH